MDLNPEQIQATNHLDGPCVVTAVPGSGKTRTLTTRVVSLIRDHNINPKNILCATFTNKAAEEMRERIAAEIGQLADRIFIGTFHAFCIAVLRKYGHLIGLGPGFSIYDDKDQAELMQKVARMEGYDYGAPKIKELIRITSDFREDVYNPEHHVENLPADERMVIQAYLDAMDQLNAVDFSGILYKCWLLLKQDHRVVDQLSGRFRYLMIDESQDMNEIQYDITKRVGAHGNLFYVGDYNQCVHEDEILPILNGSGVNNVRAGDLPESGKILSYRNGKPTHQIFCSQTSDATDGYRFTLQSGAKISVSKNHRMYSTGLANTTHDYSRRQVYVCAHSKKGSQVYAEWPEEKYCDQVKKLITPAKSSKYQQRWRCRKFFSKYTDASSFAYNLADVLDASICDRMTVQGQHLFLTTASAVKKGCSLPVMVNDRLVLEKIEKVEPITGKFISIEVEDTSVFFNSSGILSHNSIFSWRGARPEILRRLSDDFSDLKEYVLHRNYRSTSQILEAAQRLIRNNYDAGNVELLSEKGRGRSIHIEELGRAEDEAEFVSCEIRKLSQLGHKWSDFAVLYRMNTLSRLIEVRLRRDRIPYKVVGGFSFFDRREVKTAMSYMKLLANPNDTIAFSRAMTEPKRGVGQVAIGRVEKFCHDKEISILEACDRIDEIPKISRKAKNEIASFGKTFSRYAGNVKSISQSVMSLLRDIGYIDHLEEAAKKNRDEQQRVDNVSELVKSVAEFEQEKPSATIGDYLQTIQIMSSEDDADAEDAVCLMSMHSAKGLEFTVVFVVGCNNKIIPHYRAIAERGEEEERRLMYVAVTRAQERLYLLRPRYATKFNQFRGSVQSTKCDPSPFLLEISEQYVPEW